MEGYSALESIQIPNGVTEIVGATFQGCTALESIALPESVTEKTIFWWKLIREEIC